MSGYEHEHDRVWDEYQWERFLQQQDHKTEKYMELLEKYLDHPQRGRNGARDCKLRRGVEFDRAREDCALSHCFQR